MSDWLREIKIDTVFKMMLTAFIWAISTYVSKLETRIDGLQTRLELLKDLANETAADERSHNALQEWRILQLERDVGQSSGPPVPLRRGP